MEVSHLETKQIRALIKRLEREVTRREAKDKRDLLREFRKMSAEVGVSMTDLAESVIGKPGKAKKPVRKKAAAKKPRLPHIYFNPENPKQGWSGQGRRPQWVLDWMQRNHGASLDGLRKNQSFATSPASY